MIHLNSESDSKLNEALRKMSAELSKLEDKLTEEQVFHAIKEAVLSGDFQRLVQTGHTSSFFDNKFTVTKRVAVTYLPYREAMRREQEFKRYKEVVNSIINEEQRIILAQKLHQVDAT